MKAIKSLFFAAIIVFLASYVSISYMPILNTLLRWSDLISAPNWGDVVSAACATIALGLGFVTYINWSQSKVRDDLYNSIRFYIECFAKLSVQTVNSFTMLDGIVPKAGLPVVSKEEAIEQLKEIEMLMGAVGESFKNLHYAKDEAEFWGTRLSKTGDELHEATARATQNYITCYFVTMNQAYNFYAHELPLNELEQEAEKLKTRFHEMRLIFSERKNSRIRELFLF